MAKLGLVVHEGREAAVVQADALGARLSSEIGRASCRERV